ncbi:MAG: class II glutamine amidotransferase, partial [Omnitrophica bacterium]|nr:class II glutamine amidotransferase [Candidatus Omnitrophota bacterium]
MCGIFGVIGHKDAARLTYLGLYALQHRGEESAGIVTYSGKRFKQHKGMGLVGDVFDEKVIKSLRGELALGHTRYSTTGASLPKNIQPFLVRHRRTNIAISHNGNLTNTLNLHQALEEKGSIFQTTMDSELIAHLLVKSNKTDLNASVVEALSQLEGAYSLVLMVNDS